MQPQEATTKALDLMVGALREGKKILVCGNGGSASQAQHFAAELVVRYKHNRRALPCIALTADSAILTACANDFGFGAIFARQVQAYGHCGDVLVAISTSGKSGNVLGAIKEAHSRGLYTIGLCGLEGFLSATPSIEIRAEWAHTSNIQVQHLDILHRWAEKIEEAFL